jgi:hypothetical protein
MSSLLRSATMAAGSKLFQARHLSISATIRFQNLPPRDNLNSSGPPSEGASPLKIRMGILAQESPPSHNKAGTKFLRRLGRAMAAKPLRETVEELAAGVVYAEEPGGLVVVNKSYGLPVNAAEDSPVSLTACLPGLAERLGAGYIKIIIFFICNRIARTKICSKLFRYLIRYTYLSVCFVSVWKTSKKKDCGKAGEIFRNLKVTGLRKEKTK